MRKSVKRGKSSGKQIEKQGGIDELLTRKDVYKLQDSRARQVLRFGKEKRLWVGKGKASSEVYC
jgi:hypothetical protein